MRAEVFRQATFLLLSCELYQIAKKIYENNLTIRRAVTRTLAERMMNAKAVIKGRSVCEHIHLIKENESILNSSVIQPSGRNELEQKIIITTL